MLRLLQVMGRGKRRSSVEEQSAGIVALGVTILLFALLTASASAVGEPITISPTSGPPGTTVTVNGSGWQGSSDVPIQINGTTLATAHPDANGNFSVQITIPKDAAPGSRVRIDALLGNGGSANAWFDVTEPANSSPGGNPGIGSGTQSDIDLEVTKIDPLGQRICAGSNVTFRASIRNNGSTDSGFFNIRWIADNSQHFDGGHYSIPAGATDTHDHIWKNLSAGKHTLEFIADFDKQKSETDENNNQFTLLFTADNCSTGTGAGTGNAFTNPMDVTPTLVIPYNEHGRRPDTGTCYGEPYTSLWHAGEDWFAPVNTPIKAVGEGVVTYVSPSRYSYPGAVVIIKHTLPEGSHIWSMYGHLDPKKITVSKGDPVTQGNLKIADGLIKQTYNGNHDNTHLHWEMRHFPDGSGINSKASKYKDSCSGPPGPGYTYPGRPDNFVANDGAGPTYRWTDPSAFVKAH